MKKLALTLTLLTLFLSFYGQNNDTIILNEIKINSSRIDIKEDLLLKPVQIIDKILLENSSDNDISSSIKEFSTIDIRQRAFGKVQSDISIRGGSFDQAVVLLNGINLTDPQTGHYNLNIPISNSDLYGTEIIYGGASRILGVNAFSGAINFISRIPETSNLGIDISYASFNTLSASINADLVLKKFKQTISADFSQSDGFMYNTDYKRINIYYENNFYLGTINGKFMAGFLGKDFGSYGFYTPQYINQFEKIKTGFAALKLTGGNSFKWNYKLYYRTLRDQYQLFREGKGFYSNNNNLWINSETKDTITWYKGHNNHLTSVAGTGFNIEKVSILGKSSVGTEFRFEHIYSNQLGNLLNNEVNDLYTHSDNRQNISIYADHGYYGNKFLINFGALTYWNEKYKWNFYYGMDAGYNISKKLILKAGVNKTMRLPTFTDLYYQGVANIGNPELLPESALTFDIGGQFHISENSFININIFERLGKNIISWVRDYNSTVWKSENLTEINTFGVEFSAGYKNFPEKFYIKSVNISYAFLYQDKSSADLESKYALDYLKHKFIFNIEHKIIKRVSALWSLNLFKRNGDFDFFDYNKMLYTGPISYKTNLILNFKTNIDLNKFTVYLNINNLTNSDYFDIGNIPTPGISFLIGIKYRLK